jgi:hypothetical protein
MPLPRADLESLLRARQLDRTLTTTLPPVEYDAAACGVTALDVHLGGGFPRGQVSELVGRRSSGRTSLLHQMLAAATARGELVALVDALDMFDVESASAAGIDLDRLLWIRGHVVTNPGMCRDMNQRALEQALRAFTLVLQAGNFGLVAFDVAEAPSHALRRLPFTTWLRLQRMVEGSQTICLLVGSEPMARSSAGLTVRVGIRDSGTACGSCEAPEGSARSAPLSASRFSERLFDGLDVDVQIVSARWRRSVLVDDDLRRSVLDAREGSARGQSERGWGPASREEVPSASAPSNRGGGGGPAAINKAGAPRGSNNVRLSLSTHCA